MAQKNFFVFVVVVVSPVFSGDFFLPCVLTNGGREGSKFLSCFITLKTASSSFAAAAFPASFQLRVQKTFSYNQIPFKFCGGTKLQFPHIENRLKLLQTAFFPIPNSRYAFLHFQTNGFDHKIRGKKWPVFAATTVQPAKPFSWSRQLQILQKKWREETNIISVSRL